MENLEGLVGQQTLFLGKGMVSGQIPLNIYLNSKFKHRICTSTSVIYKPMDESQNNTSFLISTVGLGTARPSAQLTDRWCGQESPTGKGNAKLGYILLRTKNICVLVVHCQRHEADLPSTYLY